MRPTRYRPEEDEIDVLDAEQSELDEQRPFQTLTPLPAPRPKEDVGE